MQIKGRGINMQRTITNDKTLFCDVRAIEMKMYGSHIDFSVFDAPIHFVNFLSHFNVLEFRMSRRSAGNLRDYGSNMNEICLCIKL